MYMHTLSTCAFPFLACLALQYFLHTRDLGIVSRSTTLLTRLKSTQPIFTTWNWSETWWTSLSGRGDAKYVKVE